MKFLTAFSLDNCDAFVFCVDFGNNFCILRLTIFKDTSKSSVFFVENGSFRKLTGKIKLSSISLQELSKTF